MLVSPAMPSVAEEIWRRIGLRGSPTLRAVSAAVMGPVPGGPPVEKGEPLFPRIQERRMSAWTDAHCHLQDEFLDDPARRSRGS